ncbi:phage major tail protein, TP901-1 family [Hyphomonas sp. WL0036]|uniref:phage major tail protein, TP901-1 family n=1 Tax=Hyphomonas sediminis TaxID=2866160 RepID=UPI001C823014|nr:phage major tail protein, TP901-1 family [Hyphomonas sediminis]MBY9067286.1 phage major tail protein, TP901-1 family [Hyphomonas sediminis]
MAGQRGRDLLLKISDGAGAFVTVAGVRASRIELNAGMVDATGMDSPDAWRELIAGAGTKTARVTGRGVFRDAASDARMRAVFFAGEAPDWQLVLPHFGILQGAFQISQLSWSGTHEGEAEFSVTLESAAALGFEAQI